MLTHAILTPHPPAIIPAVGGQDARAFSQTIDSLVSVAQELKDNPPDTIIVLSCQGEILADRFGVRVPQEDVFRTDFSQFGDTETTRQTPRDRVLTAQIIEGIAGAGMQAEPVTDPVLDYGAAVPLHYLTSGLPGVELVSMSISFAGVLPHYHLGQVLRQIAGESDKRIAFVASAELSHAVNDNSPFGQVEGAAEWDEAFVADLRAGETASILSRDSFEVEEMGAEQYRAVCTLLGLVGEDGQLQSLTYEAPGGIGCVTGWWRIVGAA